jgi:hypothetical protein
VSLCRQVSSPHAFVGAALCRLLVLSIPLLATIGCQAHRDSAANTPGLTPQQSATVDIAVRAFMANVAKDVTAEGPTAWHKQFADSPAFFMASEGQLAFPNSQAAAQGIDSFARTIKHMELRWGDDLRVDPLTPDLAVVGASWQEVRVDTEGHELTERGYFTAVAEKHNSQWQFRDAHWSVPPAKSQ